MRNAFFVIPQHTEAGEVATSASASPQHDGNDVRSTGLSVVYEPDSEPTLDIIFVHGLQGHPFKTWALESLHQNEAVDDRQTSRNWRGRLDKFGFKRSGESTTTRKDASYVFWPRDLLPVECPGARILVFGYDTIVAKHQFAGAVNKNSIFAHSKDLVNELSRARPVERPILFVTHSLGGIIIKEVCSTRWAVLCYGESSILMVMFS
ncbi:putative protein SERAC1 [Rosellinia necatrix]|uniref:Uncharacterized protein n=1 Tax=Rosellinia necatrix TaxID=77044 RepID=A0A1S8A4Y7_ROSNE|nr:putative protein SERAC1 [Rosellinia necatrix]